MANLSGTGPIGSTGCTGFLPSGHSVRVADNFSTGFTSNLEESRNCIELV